MKMIIRMLCVWLCCSATVVWANTPLTDSEITKRVEDLLQKMTLEEKVAQMRIFHARLGIELSDSGQLELSDDVKNRLKYGIAGIKNPGEHMTAERAALKNNLLQKYIIENSRLGIPGLFVTEAYNGVDAHGSTKFARPINMASSWNPELVHDVWDVIGREARLRGLHMCHSPEADIMRDPRFGRMSEAFSEDTYLTEQMIIHAVNGVQGDYTGLAATHIGAVTKHFAGYGQIEGGRNFASIQISPRTFIDEILPPFKAAVQQGRTLGIMASHGDINGVASHGSRELLTNILRKEWGFKGYTVSDANDIARLWFFMGVAEGPDAAALMGLDAGMDIDLYSDDAYSRLPRLAKEDPSIMPKIDQSVRHVLRTKFILGLFDNPYIDVNTVAAKTRSERSMNLALKLVKESAILLKNDNNTLPLDGSKLKKIALVGPLIDENTVEQFQMALGDKVKIFAEQGFHLTDGEEQIPELLPREEVLPGYKKALKAAKKADVVVVFVGGDEYTAKEGFFAGAYGDRTSLNPVGMQDELVSAIADMKGKKVIVVLKHRRTLAINTISEKADAILDIWDSGEMGDLGAAQLILGDGVPSGKLSVTVPRSIGQIPFHYSQKAINFKKGYLFEKDGPLYPFGYGLSYTDFEYSDFTVPSKPVKNGSSFNVSVKVTNKGKVAAKEVVQLYVKDVIGSVIRPQKELKAFDKVSIAPGETKTVNFTVTTEMLTFTAKDMTRKVEPGDFVLMVGGNSSDTLNKEFKVVN